MERSKLSDHIFKKGKFITPINAIPMMQELPDEKSWTYGRMPEYLWIGLILNKYGRSVGLQKMYEIITLLHRLAPELQTARISQILALDEHIQARFYKGILLNVSKDTLAPLTVFLTVSYAPVFAEYFYCSKMSVDERSTILIETMNNIMGHQTHDATDIRFVALYFGLLGEKIHIMKEQGDLLAEYPRTSHESEKMKLIRPTVRSLELMLLQIEDIDATYSKHFWRCISKMTACDLYSFKFPADNRDISGYVAALHAVFDYLSELFQTAKPLDDKMKVILGIATYSYKRFKEAYEHNLFNSISGRSCVRILIEDYIMLKYLSKNENSHDNIWKDFQFYGIGQYKLVLARHRENPVTEECHFDMTLVDALVNEFKEEEFLDMDTKYFDSQNIRAKAEAVGEKSLYGLYYDYDSAFEHGLWGAVRESSLLKCTNPAHQYHCVPDIEDQNRLKSVLHDCIFVMNKTIQFLDSVYGIPRELLEGVINYELQPIEG